MSLLSPEFAAAAAGGAVTAAMPLLLAGLGEQLSERAGVLNVGIEGMMLAGAYAGFVAAYHSDLLWPGYAAGALAGMAVAAPMALLCVRRALNQVVVGIALTLAAEGLTALLHHVAFARLYPRLPAPGVLWLDRPWPDFAALALGVALTWLYRRTHAGLHLAAAGDAPEALEAAGVSVRRARTLAVLGAGALAGLGGAYLAEIGAGVFVPFMTNGAGFIGIVLAMLARGEPWRVALGALLFGLCLSATTTLQLAGAPAPTDIVQMLPFAMVMLLVALAGRRARLPAALGVGLER